MPYTGTVPTVDDFRARFPSFDSVTYSDDHVQLVLDEATLQVDDSWNPAAAPLAIQYLTAHILSTEQFSGGGAAGSGFLKSESVGPVHYTYDLKSMDIEKYGNLGLTVYGQRWRLLLLQNRSGPLLI
jgi:hypothetical protein